MRYKNSDPFEKKKAAEIIVEMLELYDNKIQDCVKRNFYNKQFGILSRELQYDVSDGLAKAFGQKLSGIHFDDTGVTDDSSKTPSEYDMFWNNDVNQNSDSDSDSDSAKKGNVDKDD
ncbi:MAG: hypothetical protein E6L04_08955 [Thaumarchaeota archaeon]|nr:MAG: hypothetical protein E6L04_08955 [Nitrososphaerota archaeon]TLX87273.1 MAG: hypothetical protein E6K97_08955 [Nitrososphaerota archaeon]